MINYSKYQHEIVKQLLNSGRIGYAIAEDGNVLASKDNVTGLVMKPNQIVFSLDRCFMAGSGFVEQFKKRDSDILCQSTKVYEKSRLGNVQKWASEEFEIWFSESLLSDLGNPSELYASSPLDRAVFVSGSGDVLGIILPVRHRD